MTLLSDISRDSTISGKDEIMRATAMIVSAYAQKNEMSPGELMDLMGQVQVALEEFSTGERKPSLNELKPAVPIEKSIEPDAIICLEDGKRLKMLKRYLRSRYDMSPEDYRARWGLPPDYPMVAPNYAKERSRLAKECGLGRVTAASDKE